MFLPLLVLSCPLTEDPPWPPGPEDPVRNLERWDAFANRVQKEGLIAAWKRAAEQQPDAKPASFGVAPLLMLEDAEVAALRRRLEGSIHTDCLRAIHAVSVRMQSETDHGVANALSEISSLRQEIPDLATMFTDDEDRLRRERLWRSQAGIARSLEPLVRRLVAARNRWASRRSRTRYLELMGRHRGYDPETAERLEREVRLELQRRGVRRSRPWEFELIDPLLAQRIAQRFGKEGCQERASFVFTFLGLPAAPPTLRIEETAQTSFSAFASYPIEPPADQRVTIRPGAGITPHWSTFHEFGHAAMSLLATPGSCRTASRPVSAAVSESCAKIAERMFFSAEWLSAQGLPADEIESLRSWEAHSELMRMRSILADVEFERVLYESPDAPDLMDRFIAIQRKTAGVELGRDFPAWTLKRHLAFEPLARTDYLLARCGQAAVYRRLRELPGGLLGEAARQVMRDEVFRGATALRYEEWFRRATKTEPNCSAWLEDVPAT